MSTYRTGGYWRRTIVRVGTQPPDADGRRPDDALAGLMDDPALAERICELLNGQSLLALVRDLTDPDECWFDHHGHCQAHGWTATDRLCPHGRAKKILEGRS